MNTNPVEDPHDRLLALLPVAKNAEILEQIATSMDVDMAGIAGNRKALLGKLLVHLHSPDFEALAEKDRLVQEAITALMEHLGFMPALEGDQNGPAAPDLRGGRVVGMDGTPKQEIAGGRGDRDTRDTRRPNPRSIKKDSSDEDSEIDSNDSDSDDFKDALTDHKRSKRRTSRSEMAARTVKLKDFKINGTVGEPGEKGKLTYGSLAHQINTGRDMGFDETEIVSAVIRCITPGHTTRTYLEGQRRLTLEALMSTMQAHFYEKDITSLYNKLTAATQGVTQPPLKFLFAMFALRDQVIDLSRGNKRDERRYSRKLVQAEMQKGIYAGLRDPNIRQDLKMLLREPDVDDHELMRELTQAVVSQEEHEKRLEESRGKSKGTSGSASVSMVGREIAENPNNNNNNLNTNNMPTNNNIQTYSDRNTNNHNNTHSDNSNNNYKHNQDNNSYNNNNNSNSNLNNPSNLPVNLDPFVAQLTSAIGVRMQGIVDPLQAQVSELMGFKQDMEKSQRQEEQKVPDKTPLNVNATDYKTPQVVGDGKGIPPSTGVAAHSTSDGIAGGYENFAGLLMQALQGVQSGPVQGGPPNYPQNDGGLQNYTQHTSGPPFYPQHPGQGRGRGRGRGGNNNWGNNNNRDGNNTSLQPLFNNSNTGYAQRDGNSFTKCSICRAANAWACNHCKICHGVDHRNVDCPHKDDPTYVPKN